MKKYKHAKRSHIIEKHILMYEYYKQLKDEYRKKDPKVFKALTENFFHEEVAEKFHMIGCSARVIINSLKDSENCKNHSTNS